jgi:hypothetical protein
MQSRGGIEAPPPRGEFGTVTSRSRSCFGSDPQRIRKRAGSDPHSERRALLRRVEPAPSRRVTVGSGAVPLQHPGSDPLRGRFGRGRRIRRRRCLREAAHVRVSFL